MNENMLCTMNKTFLIKIILWKDKKNEKWPVKEYKQKQKPQNTKTQKTNQEKYIPPHMREKTIQEKIQESILGSIVPFEESPTCELNNSDDDDDDDKEDEEEDDESFEKVWDDSYQGWYMPGDEMKRKFKITY